jgi:hypothetical protein
MRKKGDGLVMIVVMAKCREVRVSLFDGRSMLE